MDAIAAIAPGPQTGPSKAPADPKISPETTDAVFSLLLGSLLGMLVPGPQQAPAQPEAPEKTAPQKTGSATEGKKEAVPPGTDTAAAAQAAEPSEEKTAAPGPMSEDAGGGKAGPAAKAAPDKASKGSEAPPDHGAGEKSGSNTTTARAQPDARFLKEAVKAGGPQKKTEAGPAPEKERTTTGAVREFSTALANEASAPRHVQDQPAEVRQVEGVKPPPTADPVEPPDGAVTIVKDGTRIAVKLEPDGLGKLDINLSLDKGSINAQIQVADGSTKSLLESNMRQIVDSLLKEGLSVGGFSVSLKNGGQEYAAPDQPDARGSENRVKTLGAAPEQARSAASGLINLFV